ncbi:MAG: adenylate kinase [Frankiales bacterium]|nr:adenylate kinase [Frankiales bacterium]
MRVVLIGPPGSGKGTQAVRLAKHYGAVHIAAGDLLRAELAAGTELGLRVQQYLSSGDLVPDDLVVALLWGRIVEAARDGGYVLDGFPRTAGQAEAAYRMALEAGVTAHAAVYLDGDSDALVARMLARAHVDGRVDDTAEVIAHRLAVFAEQTAPLVDYYERRGLLIRIDAMLPADEVTKAIIKALDATERPDATRE